MTNHRRVGDAPEHHEIAALIPWYVNSTLAEHDRQKVEAHLCMCAICRDDLLVEQRIFEGIGADTAVEYMPVASLRRLQARLDAAQQDSLPEAAPAERVGGKLSWRAAKAASVAVMAIALSLLLVDRWVQFRAHLEAPNYRTVTNSSPRPPEEVIRAVFAPTVTLVEMQALLEESQLKIISGPTEAGVYSLAATSNRPVSASLALLRRHETVRFAEGTGPEPEPDKSQ
jgi:hypothetical protein